MASFTLTRPDVFPDSTSVGAYPRSNWTTVDRIKGPTGAGVGSATSSASVSSGSVTFTGLADNTDYYAVGQVSSVYYYVRFKTPPLPTVLSGSGVTSIVALTQAAYDALTPDDATLYVITG